MVGTTDVGVCRAVTAVSRRTVLVRGAEGVHEIIRLEGICSGSDSLFSLGQSHFWNRSELCIISRICIRRPGHRTPRPLQATDGEYISCLVAAILRETQFVVTCSSLMYVLLPTKLVYNTGLVVRVKLVEMRTLGLFYTKITLRLPGFEAPQCMDEGIHRINRNGRSHHLIENRSGGSRTTKKNGFCCDIRAHMTNPGTTMDTRPITVLDVDLRGMVYNGHSAHALGDLRARLPT
ncbi:hypothetical protein BDM02DRAFT_2029581 [Thelephora ganbajun]|uniref:Uncharacterized protein n=1 Tax=Thelephora ganbajun TaxID=370292 RepID=A0ACB6YZ57_THEGA|nr:hypothetical protein BDM02DRAFT_2029581 [Thelephora ganbajun]